MYMPLPPKIPLFCSFSFASPVPSSALRDILYTPSFCCSNQYPPTMPYALLRFGCIIPHSQKYFIFIRFLRQTTSCNPITVDHAHSTPNILRHHFTPSLPQPTPFRRCSTPCPPSPPNTRKHVNIITYSSSYLYLKYMQ